ncbi:hypothetical protein MSAN_01786400 [Mycena sanguinolenta]|uniref:Uncharacterized protein n=1 Tax=Mycena sanguinolenta TaxID=230812 RepID=A0A8H7CUC8_9AGAR|nr:hypothetical protein MSAN_01786400 [Mycena sanguinolenta]
MKSTLSSASPSSLRSTRFSPYKPPLTPRPSTMTLRHGTRLRTARLNRSAALDCWLKNNITDDALHLPDRNPGPEEALCVIYMSVAKGAVEGDFKNPDTYRLSFNTEDAESRSPLVRLGWFVGSNEEGDAPLWTRILTPGRLHYFMEPKTFAAQLMCGMTNIRVESVSSADISPQMCRWALTASKGTWVEQAVNAHCQGIDKSSDERRGGFPSIVSVGEARRAKFVKYIPPYDSD